MSDDTPKVGEGRDFVPWATTTIVKLQTELRALSDAHEKATIENGKLRALVKKAEWNGDPMMPQCPWCGSTKEGKHDAKCEAEEFVKEEPKEEVGT